MDFFRIALLALFAVICIVIVRQLKQEFVLPLIIGVSVVIVSMLCDELFDLVYTFHDFSQEAHIDSEAVACVVKVVGIGYLAEFTNNICLDANCKSIGDKVLLTSKIAILFCALPFVEKLFGVIRELVA
ncbi:MAG: stage III sporulation AC/AD family protein [Corallococcus sp.]|nr:stage III sporulation AC/AD family protein [Corallococcus sp.]